MKITVKKLCSKEKVGRLIVALVLLLIAAILSILGFIPRILITLVGVYLLVTAFIGSCLLYSVWKE